MKLKMLALLPTLLLPLAGLNLDARAAVSPTASVATKAKPVKAKKTKKPKTAKKEHWVCPMHDGGESDHAGKCPKCGMDLVKEETK